MENIETESITDGNESEAEQGSIKEKSENSLIDITTLDFKSRLCLKTTETYGEATHTNGISRVNGVCNSPERTASTTNLPESQSMETSRLNQHGKTDTLPLGKKDDNIQYVSYTSELQMPDIMKLIQKDLSEPYSIYTYRYFIHNWPKLCFLAMHGDECVGAIVCKLDIHRKVIKRGYIAMLAVDVKYRKRKIGSNLVRRAIQAMVEDNADEVVLETEITNRPALRLYENLGFVRDKRLFRYYLNGVDALRLKLWLR
ncbi:N-alpha-acetyltransferase 30 isoform X1 [Osmia lignaria lignaria]|uniref:N-alpha-acetyltransferase 30 isoform X1 n=1 Tax=Osmia lignaria lignaria TaxID=1437193 RepID=UPI00147959DE|nr:N-alpha-acetyltransferase 30-like isoform X1 [Osmia lignaria]XP_034184124.1 N-alpha-acetyltransferase 30-like isoform X1 [Osmia lignaria]XP_034184125.1 N-alpha-acetyltransferase 30-like isoform X1 [Osmia lignaria]XP_034184126.1 N-alpha-acetyltransferase 30-like isoform X1 [Osmia lignaria]